MEADTVEDEDEVEEYVLESPTSIDKFMQEAMREAREAPGYKRDPNLNDIFPGGVVHKRALNIARERGMFRSVASAVILPALGGEGDRGVRALPPPAQLDVPVEESAAISAEASVAGNTSASASTPASQSKTAAATGAGSAWGSGDVLGGLLVMEGSKSQSGGNSPEAALRDVDTAAVGPDPDLLSSSFEDDGGGDDSRAAALVTPTDRYRRGAEVGAAIAAGAIANSGALPRPEAWGAAAHEALSPMEVPWLVAQQLAEAKAARAFKERRAKERERDQEQERLAADAQPPSPTSSSASSSSSSSRGSSLATSSSSASTSVSSAVADNDKVDERYATMLEWFQSKGGRLDGVNVTFVPGKAGDGRGLVATSRLEAGARVLRVPASLTLSSISARNLRVQGNQVGEHLKPLFASKPEQALAVLLLHEHLKEHLGTGSAWGPYLRTLGHPALGTPVLRALAGTYAAEVYSARQAEAMKIYQELSGGICSRAQSLCHRSPGRHQGGSFTRDDLRWSMGVVRSRAVWITRRTTGQKFLALVPFLDLMPHHPDAGGGATLELDNSIGVSVGCRAGAGAELAADRGNVTDAESLLRWHQVTPGNNPGNGVRLQLPGAEVEGADIIRKVELLRRWRKEMAMPPRGADLWRGASALGLYGDSDEELEAIKSATSQSTSHGRRVGLAALGPNGADGITVEEELMLTGQAATPAAAAAAAAKYVGLTAVPFARAGGGGGDFMLYSAPDPDEPGGDDPLLEHSRKELAKLALQTQAAAAFGESSETPGGDKEAGDAKTRSDGGDAAAEALRTSRDFFERGVPPPRGLDTLDLFLLRKGHLMSKCGRAADFLVHAAGPSAALMCSTRVLLANETEVKALEGGGPDPHWNGDRDVSGYQFSEARGRGEVHEPFDPSRPLSVANERAALKRLALAATNILMAYPTTEREDLERLLEDPDLATEDEDEGEDEDDLDNLDAEWDSDATAASASLTTGASVSDGEEFDAREASAATAAEGAATVADKDNTTRRRRMPRSIRVPGGLVQSAVALRLREKRLLKSAVRWLALRASTLDQLLYQVDEKERERVARGARAEARRARGVHLRHEYATPRNLSSVEVDVVVPETPDRPAANRKATVWVREGDVLEAVVRTFMAEHSLLDSAFGILTDALRRAVRPRPRLLVAVPVIVPAGVKEVLAVREGDNVSEIVHIFADLHEIPDGVVPGLSAKVSDTLRARSARRLLLSVPVSAPDGRTVHLEVRDGEQHDLLRLTAEWVAAERIPADTVEQIANAAFSRLGDVLVAMPVDVPGRVRQMLHVRVRDAEGVRTTVESFCEVNDLGAEAVLPLVRGALSRLNPGSILINADPPPKSAGEGT